jgi:hypothetical protein
MSIPLDHEDDRIAVKRLLADYAEDPSALVGR